MKRGSKIDRRRFIKGMLLGLPCLHLTSFYTDHLIEHAHAFVDHEKSGLPSGGKNTKSESCFVGSYFRSIDSQGRIMLPSEFYLALRAEGHGSVIVIRQRHRLMVYTLDEWRNMDARIRSIANASESVRQFRRTLMASACECCCSDLGHIQIPSAFRQYAELDEEIVLVGLCDHFEIWSRMNWNRGIMQDSKPLSKHSLASSELTMKW